MGTFGILFLVSFGVAVIAALMLLLGDFLAPADTILGCLGLVGILGVFIFGMLAAFFDPSKYVVYKKEGDRVWLERDDGLYFWVDNLNAPNEGDVIYLSYADLKQYSTSKH